MLIIIRHAIAEPKEGWRSADSLRPLTEKGRDRFERVARAITVTAAPSLILSSSLTRAVETAKILASATGARIEKTPLLLPNADPQDLLDDIEERPQSTIAVVGHEPMIGRLAERCTGLRFGNSFPGDTGTVFKKGMAIACEGGRVAWALSGRGEPLELKQAPCPSCGGSGSSSSCPGCKGSGSIQTLG